jgi:hypothetical protein
MKRGRWISGAKNGGWAGLRLRGGVDMRRRTQGPSGQSLSEGPEPRGWGEEGGDGEREGREGSAREGHWLGMGEIRHHG